MRIGLLVALSVPLAACDGGGPPSPSASAPRAPQKSDSPGFVVTGDRAWYLVGNDLTAGEARAELDVTAPAGTEVVDAWLDGVHATRAELDGGGFALTIDLAAVAPGRHELLLAADGAGTAFAQRFFERSHPLYVVVSNDWDDPDNADPTLDRQERLHDRHPELILTHFVGPYTFTDPGVSPARRQTLVDWVTGMRDQHGDEIGLHIHPRCSFVEHAGLACRAAPSFARASDATGYTVYLGAYGEAEVSQMLAAADALFAQHGLGKPTSFRAGGWTLEPSAMRALAANGFVADTSAANWSRLEEWADDPGATLFAWNMENWAPIDERSQPYYPAADDLLSDAPPLAGVLEVPDNGLLVDYVSAPEMIEMFEANWSGVSLARPTVYSIGYHPPNFSELFFDRMDDTLTHIDQFLASADRGPVVYARLSDLARVWPRP